MTVIKLTCVNCGHTAEMDQGITVEDAGLAECGECGCLEKTVSCVREGVEDDATRED